MKAALIVSSLVALSATACGDCFTLIVRINPPATTIRVGQSFNLRHEDSVGCGSPLSPGVTSWHTVDTLVVRLDTLSGMVMGRSPGTAHVAARNSDIDWVIRVDP
jgi:hypothetical protein